MSCGKYVTRSAWLGIPADVHNTIQDWPRSPPSIPAAWWQLWRTALLSTVCTDTRRLFKEVQIKSPLPTHWKWWASPSRSEIFHLEGHVWRKFEPRSRRPTRIGISEFLPSELLLQEHTPTDLTWITVHRRKQPVIWDASDKFGQPGVSNDDSSDTSSSLDQSNGSLSESIASSQAVAPVLALDPSPDTGVPVQGSPRVFVRQTLPSFAHQPVTHRSDQGIYDRLVAPEQGIIHPKDVWASSQISGSVPDLLMILC